MLCKRGTFILPPTSQRFLRTSRCPPPLLVTGLSSKSSITCSGQTFRPDFLALPLKLSEATFQWWRFISSWNSSSWFLLFTPWFSNCPSVKQFSSTSHNSVSPQMMLIHPFIRAEWAKPSPCPREVFIPVLTAFPSTKRLGNLSSFPLSLLFPERSRNTFLV